MSRRLPPPAAVAPAVDPLMRAMLDASPLGVVEYELRGDDLLLVQANAAAGRILAVDFGPLVGCTLEQAFPDQDPAGLPAACRAVARGGPPHQRSEYAYRGGGFDGIFEIFVFRVAIGRIAVMFRDVAPERRAAQAIAESEARFAAVFRGSPEAITVVRLDDHTLVDVNPAFERATGVPRAEAIGRRALDLGLWVDPAQRSALIQRLQNADYVIDFEFTNQPRGRPPQQAVLSTYRVAIGGVPHIVTVTREISAERRAEAERAANAERIRRIFDLIPEPVAVIEVPSGRHLDINRAWSAAFGYSRDDVVGRTSLEFGLWPDGSTALRRNLIDDLARGGELAGIAVQFRHQSGRLVDVELTGALLDMPDGKVGIWVGRDVTQQRRAEAERAANAERIRRIFDLIPEPVAVIENATGRYLDINRTWTAIFGYARDEVVGRTSTEFGLWPAGSEARRAELIARLAHDGEVSGVSVQYLCKNRKLIDIQLSAELIEMPEGKVGIWVGRDVTEERRLQAALVASELRLRRVFELFPEPVGIIDHPSGRYLDVNRAWERVYGWTREQARGKTTLDLGMWPEVAPRAPLLERLTTERELIGVEVQYRRSDGQLIDAELSAALVDTPDGPMGIWVGRDITESKRLREVTRASEERLATMFRIAPAAMALTHRDGARFIDVNDAWLALFGYQRSEVIGPEALEVKMYLDLSQRTELVLAIERLGRVDRREIMLRRRDGALVHVLLSGQRFDLPEQPAVLWSGLDITDRKRAEQTLRESEQRLRAVVRSAPVVLTVLDRAGVIRISEGQGLAALGLQPGELIGRSVHELYAGQPQLLAAIRRALGGATSRLTVDTGSAVTDVQFAPLADSFGGIDGVISVAVNVTERVVAERALEQSQAKFKAFFELAPFALTVAGADARFTEVNRRFLDLVGRTEGELIGRRPDEVGLLSAEEFSLKLGETMDARALRDAEAELRHSDGSLRTLLVSTALMDVGGEQMFLAASVDITERKRMEQALAESEARFVTVFNESPVAMAVTDPVDERCESANDAFLKLFGYAREEIVGFTSAEKRLFAEPAERQQLLDLARTVGALQSMPRTMQCKDGTRRLCEVTGRAISIGGRTRLLWAVLDVTAQRAAEQTLRESEARFAATFNQSPVAMAVTDPATDRGENINDAFVRLFGYTREEAIGATSTDLQLFADEPGLEAMLQELNATGALSSRTCVIRCKDGTRRVCELSARTIFSGGRKRLLWAALDVTAQREAEQTLRESEARFATMFNQSPVAMAVTDPATDRGEIANDSLVRLLGFTPEELIGADSAELGLFPVLGEREKLMEFAREKGALEAYPIIMRRKDGARLMCELTGRTISIGGQPRLLWAVTDVTAQREAEHQLRNTVTQLQTVIMAAPVVLFALDREGRFTLLEGRALQDFGLSPAQMLGRSVDDVYRDAPEVRAALQPAREGRTHSARIRLAGRSFALYCQPLNPGGASVQGVIGVLVDLTDQLRAEEALQRLNEQLERRVEERTSELARAGEELMRVEKLAALGSLVAGVAHELNTPIGNSVLVASSLADATRDLETAAGAGLRRSALNEYLSQATASAQLLQRNLQRAGDLIASFKQVAVDQTSMQRREFDLAEVLHENVTALMPSIRSLQHRVEIEAPAGIRMNSYPGPLGQVLTNLINNAVQHAFEGRGPGTVLVAAEAFGAGEVRIEVRDDGGGIASAHLARIFDPFFTTRLGRGGSGLGLNIVHNLVTGVLGGSIDVRSQPEAGTTFTLLLPRTAPPLGPPAAAGDSLLQ